MEIQNDLALQSVKIELPQASLEVLDQPESITLDHVDDVGFVARLCLNDGLFEWADGDLEDIVSLSLIDLLEGPPLNVTVSGS